MATLEDMRSNYAAAIPEMAGAWDAAKGRMVANFRAAEGVTVGPRTRAKYERKIRQASLRIPSDAPDRLVRNYAQKMAE